MAAPVAAVSSNTACASTKTRQENPSGQEESSDSDGETEPARIFHRRISTNRHIKTAPSQLVLHLLASSLHSPNVNMDKFVQQRPQQVWDTLNGVILDNGSENNIDFS
ncbi:hypothetical protein RRG08_057465 [Elysia crispata]|uniref:Uncharacterized protein n=1 Tax=Elysia crispata TaxID=231223 RepID=A0AAE0YDA4_9GAST|nr:hypothetical protein RRG08_057465 [Elysia crispata]